MRELTLLETGYLAGLLLLALVLPVLMSVCGPREPAARRVCLRTVWMGQVLLALAALLVLASAAAAPYATGFGVLGYICGVLVLRRQISISSHFPLDRARVSASDGAR